MAGDGWRWLEMGGDGGRWLEVLEMGCVHACAGSPASYHSLTHSLTHSPCPRPGWPIPAADPTFLQCKVNGFLRDWTMAPAAVHYGRSVPAGPRGPRRSPTEVLRRSPSAPVRNKSARDHTAGDGWRSAGDGWRWLEMGGDGRRWGEMGGVAGDGTGCVVDL